MEQNNQETNQIKDLCSLISKVKMDIKTWRLNTTKKTIDFRPWFRGEADSLTPLTPRLYRKSNDNKANDIDDKELRILHEFRLKAPFYVDIPIPQREHTDQWLFLAQHVGIPTRLLDWSEGLLTALYFAVNTTKKEGDINVWMLNPAVLNSFSTGSPEIFKLTWFSPELDPKVLIRKIFEPDKRMFEQPYDGDVFEKMSNIEFKPNNANRNIRAAWEGIETRQNVQTEYPVAIMPTYIHSRIANQMGRFTIWGKVKEGLDKILKSKPDILKKYVIPRDRISSMREDLKILGITGASLYHDLDHLADDIRSTYGL